ncbi:ABC transporter permease subunit [Odoribacter sp. OttesenSCG-928-J03]|nr:ABC transporter permease subunit [Odoribacter sp. OttesenSCG-928-J03]MDL2283196.1 ABC transporter permease subunit [Odoribacter sp. OttesenSCG-928-G04]MDL2331009.1 ABC transporter permease subunit [Odoribacter sp. OttesenSCG-928-A06]
MRTIKILVKKELDYAFNSWTFYIGMFLFFCICGFYCWMSESNIFYIEQASMLPFFVVIKWIFLFIIPAFAMKALADEKKNATLELLLTKPIRSNQLIGGKFFSLLIIVLIMLLLTLPYYFTMLGLGDIDHGQVVGGYLGLLLVGAFYVSISVFASAASRTTMSAFFISFGIILCFQFLFHILGIIIHHAFLSDLFTYLSVDEHFDSLSRGVLDSRDILYFLSVTLIFLALTRMALCRSRY